MNDITPVSSWTGSTYLFTQSKEFILSNERTTFFSWKGYEFNNAFAALVWAKSKLFFDEESAKLALKNQSIDKLSAISQGVENFSNSKWKESLPKILSSILLAKFSQNSDAKDVLLSIGDRTIGVYSSAPGKELFLTTGITPESGIELQQSPGLWQGENLYGNSLMKVKAFLEANPYKIHDGKK